ncbi:ABC transporter ATP-binding protein [Actinomadura madurae]|uniref:ABC transporter ATP-binding protein n=1 Tax=Actinomadura madurae TaxID=1993 RepID=UPI0020276273|nr:ABC transporter ATP-binding protein [Actinomadura madurae]URM93853.1 ABC transporter ATP-binding protein [Actinomadura madurae]URN04575.1 ABC transporter ATP-binding protein [Actinomadura madurae]
MAELVLDGLTKRFGDNVVLKDLSLTVTEGEILTLLGPSGCGKSTTLWSIAGLHRPDSGTIRFGDRVLFDGRGVHLEPEQRNFGVVFQSYAIWPHMSVADNVGYPLKLRKVGRKQRRERVMEVLELVELDRFADRYPHQLSGGQQQRVALARALAHPPHLLLLDEPFSNLDAKLRDRAREWLKALQRQIGVTTVFVTHDQHEALSMSDRIVVMESGVIHQTGTPTEVYEHPADPFVADFVGATNLLAGDVLQSGAGRALVRTAGIARPLQVAAPSAAPGPVALSIRPEAIQVMDGDRYGSGVNEVTGKVESVSYLGDHYRYTLRVDGLALTVATLRRVDATDLTVELPPDALRLLPAPEAGDQPTDNAKQVPVQVPTERGESQETTVE